MTTFEPQSIRHHRRPRAHARIATLSGLAAVILLATACGSSSSSADTPSTTKATPTTTVAPEPTAAQAALVAARPFTVHEPAGVAATQAKPLLILLHGYGVTGAIQEAYLKLTPVTDAHGMLYVYLDGTVGPLEKRFWNATDACCGPGSDVDDSAYITAVIANVKANYNVDPRRVFLTGHSNGGFMSFRMACDHADEIAGIVSIEGATWLDPKECKPSEPVATLAVHGTADQTIKYDGGTTGLANYPSATTSTATWAKYNGCRSTPDPATNTTHAIVEKLPPATVTAYSAGCDTNGYAELWTQPDGVHIPVFSPTFGEQIVSFLLAHPKQ